MRAGWVENGGQSEPDDTAGGATTISFGGSVLKSISSSGDVDWFSFTLSNPAEVVLVTSGASGDTLMRLYGPNNSTTQIAYDDDSGPAYFSRIERRGAAILQAGTYYVKVQAYSSSATIAAYTLSLRVGNRQTGFFMGENDTQGNRVSGDSFCVENTVGTCFGMSSYAKWYFETQSANRGPLFAHFTEDEQRTISARAQTDLDQRAADNAFQFANRSDYAVAEDMIAKLDSENLPQILLMGKDRLSSLWLLQWFVNLWLSHATHAVLVIGYEETASTGTFKIYNNWYTTQESALTYANQAFLPFSDGSAHVYVEFESVTPAQAYDPAIFQSANYPAP